ncbi:MAG: hypothetical protein NTW14_11655 [bacterium]|nr:hypothetical protein [bacterium]
MDTEFNKELAKIIRENFRRAFPEVRRNIRFPRDLQFSKGSDENHLTLKMTEQNVTANVQENKAAFEGWCFVVRRWTDYKSIQLSWVQPSDKSDKHYQSFLYRVKAMTTHYDWLNLPDQMANILKTDLSIKNDTTYYFNYPQTHSTRTDAEGKTVDEMTENEIEWYIFNNPNGLKKLCKLNALYRQYPVGVFTNARRRTIYAVLPHGRRCIDLWGLNNDKKELHIFELKTPQNIGVGAVSELLYYAFLMQNAIYPTNQFQIKAVREFPDRGSVNDINTITTMTLVMASFLTFRAHPLIDARLIKDMNIFRKEVKPPIKFCSITIDNSFNFNVLELPD